MRVFNPHAPSNGQPLAACYRKHENSKKRAYEQRVHEIEHGSFTPIVLSLTGGLGKAATTCYKRLTSMIAEKQDLPYSTTISWIRCLLSFSLLRSASSASEALDPPVVGMRNILSLPRTWHPQRPGSPLAESMSYIIILFVLRLALYYSFIRISH